MFTEPIFDCEAPWSLIYFNLNKSGTIKCFSSCQMTTTVPPTKELGLLLPSSMFELQAWKIYVVRIGLWCSTTSFIDRNRISFFSLMWKDFEHYKESCRMSSSLSSWIIPTSNILLWLLHHLFYVFGTLHRDRGARMLF